MRMQLVKQREEVSFIWGIYTDLPDGHVRIYSYDYDQKPSMLGSETCPIPIARVLWRKLVKSGFHRKAPK